MLTAPARFCEIRYADGFTRYPPCLTLDVEADGVLTAVVWTQRLLWESAVLFANESVIWVTEARAVRKGERVRLLVDEAFERRNELTRDPS